MIVLALLGFTPYQDVSAGPSPQFCETECLVPTRVTEDSCYEVYVENNGDEWDIINITPANSDSFNFSTEVTDSLGDPLPDTDGDGNPDTDTLQAGESRIVLADVTPEEMLPFGATDTCHFQVISSRDPEKRDTAFLITRIREVKIMVAPDTFVTEYPRNTTIIPVAAYSTSLYRADTVNLTYHSTQDSLLWPVSFTDVLGVPLQDTDGNDTLDIPNVQPDSVAEPFQVRVGIPDSAALGDRDTIYLMSTSANYPFGPVYPEVIDTTILIVHIGPVFVSEKPAAARLPELSFTFGQSVLYVSNPLEEELRLDFFDALGCRVLSRTIQESQASVDVSAFPKGVYLISAKTGQSGRITRKVVVCR